MLRVDSAHRVLNARGMFFIPGKSQNQFSSAAACKDSAREGKTAGLPPCGRAHPGVSWKRLGARVPAQAAEAWGDVFQVCPCSCVRAQSRDRSHPVPLGPSEGPSKDRFHRRMERPPRLAHFVPVSPPSSDNTPAMEPVSRSFLISFPIQIQNASFIC